jgi:hypothetical protein
MDIQAIFDMVSEKEMYRRTATGQNISLGGLIDALGGIADEEMPVIFEDGLKPGGLDSYRGYYSDLAISTGRHPLGTVGSLLHGLREAIGTRLTGYKGGKFLMERHTPVWASEYGTASGAAITGVEVRDGTAVLLMKQIDI